jgi:hypothetical protein
MHVALVVRLATPILGVFIVALTSWIPSLVMEPNLLVGLDISSRENSEKGFVDVSFVNVTGINAAVEVAGVVRSFHSVKDWLRREWKSGLYQETCKLYDRVMRLLERRKQKKRKYGRCQRGKHRQYLLDQSQ